MSRPEGSEIIDQSDSLLQRGVTAQNQLLFDDAALLFWQALTCLDKMPTTGPRRDQTRGLSELFLRAGHEDLALLASSEAARVDRSLNDQIGLIADLIFSGNVHTTLRNTAEARHTFRAVIDLCLQIGNYADAASASTNLAQLFAQAGDGEQAIALLTNSLSYLRKAPFPETEFNTHATLIQVIGLYGGDPALAVTSGTEISKHFLDRLTAQDREALAPHMLKAVEAFLQRELQPDAERWKKEMLPWLYE
jgi:tetratricopeptide (TPR) repeat protein